MPQTAEPRCEFSASENFLRRWLNRTVENNGEWLEYECMRLGITDRAVLEFIWGERRLPSYDVDRLRALLEKENAD